MEYGSADAIDLTLLLLLHLLGVLTFKPLQSLSGLIRPPPAPHLPSSLVIADPKGKRTIPDGRLVARNHSCLLRGWRIPECRRRRKEWGQAETVLMISTRLLPVMGPYDPPPTFFLIFTYLLS